MAETRPIASRLPWLPYVAAVAIVVVFVMAEWLLEPFRELLGLVSDYIPLVLYAAVVVALVGRWLLGRRRTTAQTGVTGGRVEARRPWVRAGGLAASVTGFLAPLFSSWEIGRGASLVAGVVPLGDGQLYFHGAERALFFDTLDDYSSRRPLNALFLALRLAITSLDLRLTLVLQAILLGVACYAAARVVARDLGAIAGMALFTGLYAFTYLYAQSTLTEALGVTFAALAFAALWTAVRERSPWMAASGLFLLMVGLGVRSAAPLVPVLLAVWFARYLRTKGMLNVRMLVMGAVAVAAGFSVNYTAVFIGQGNAAALKGNSGYLLYTMAKGIPAWDVATEGGSQVFRDHPEIYGIPDAQRNRIVDSLARKEVLAHPAQFSRAVVHSGVNYGRLAYRTALAPVHSRTGRALLAAVTALLLVALLGKRARHHPRAALVDLMFVAALALAIPILAVATLVPNWTNSAAYGWSGALLLVLAIAAFGVRGSAGLASHETITFALVSFAGVALQIPLLGIDTVRVFAAMAPFIALPLALAVSALDRARDVTTLENEGVPLPNARSMVRWAPVALGMGIVVITLVGFPVARATIDKPPIQTVACSDGTPAQAFFGGVSVRLVANRQKSEQNLHEVEMSVVSPNPSAILKVYDRIVEPTTVVAALDVQGNERVIFVPEGVSAPRKSALHLCGTPVSDPWADAVNACCWPEPFDFGYFTGRPIPPGRG